MQEERSGDVEGERGFFFFVPLRLSLSPVPLLRRCGTRINGIQQYGEIASGCVRVCVCN